MTRDEAARKVAPLLRAIVAEGQERVAASQMDGDTSRGPAPVVGSDRGDFSGGEAA